MTYQEVLDYLFNQFPQYQKIGGKAYKPGLDNIQQVCEYLGNPHNSLKIIHVAGTNGKGSTCSMLASILQENGYKVGLFTSPHLIDFTERIRINGSPIPQEEVVSFVGIHKPFFDQTNASFFEWTTALAFDYFNSQDVDFVVLETGLGGRLDATNIVKPLLSVITSIGIDHVQYLGDTLEKIAKEKAGIVKPTIPVVISEGNESKVIELLIADALEKECSYSISKNDQTYQSDLKGEYQVINRGVVLSILKEIKALGYTISEKSVPDGFNNTVMNTGLRGRWEILQMSPKVIADIGHNYEGVKQIVAQLRKENYSNLKIVWGMVDDKEIDKIIDLLPKDAEYFISEPDIKRALNKEKMATAMEGRLNYEIFSSMCSAYDEALNSSKPDDLIFVGGSNFVVSEIILKYFS